MKTILALTLAYSLFATTTVALAGDAGTPCTGCKPPACGAMECIFSCRPVVKKVPIEKERFNVKCEYICVPPVQLPHLCCLFGGGCEHDVCKAACADNCREPNAATARFPWRTGGKCTKCDRIRKVHKLSKEEYEDGEKCVVEWKLECVCRPIHCKPGGACQADHAPYPCAPVQ